ncbi:hypothetical protein VTP01DRAFT_9486 [Rhizomucor pusillus]|uniref:uncharacterized protein n=1 Tax=Rhizomucor pusillus TaxID=4840 RepID=UPI0037431F6E
MESECQEAIRRHIQGSLRQGASPSISTFIDEYLEVVVDHTRPGDDIERVWATRFSTVAKELKVTARRRHRPHWEKVSFAVLKKQAGVSSSCTTDPAESDAKAESEVETSSARVSSKTSSTSSKFDSCLLTPEMLEDFENDPCWGEVFEAEELQEIRTCGDPSLPALAENIQEFFDAYYECLSDEEQSSGECSLETLTAVTVSFGIFRPSDHFDQYWLQSTMLQLISAYRYKIFDKLAAHGSELDFVVRIWSLLDRCFDNLGIETRRDQCCIATSARLNEQRAVTGISPISSKIATVRPDLILVRNDVEYGLSECGKVDDAGIGKKEIIEN